MKLLLRHSIRPSLQGSKIPDLVPLTDEGKQKAYKLGQQLPKPIRYCYSSFVPRCIETLDYILKGANQHREIKLEDCLSDGVFTDKKIAGKYIREWSLKEAVFNICSPKTLPLGFKDIELCGKMLLDCIFIDIDNPDSIDIFCSHDFQLAILVTLMFNENVTIDSITSAWPEMLEGISFYGNRANFTCVWRNEEKNFINYL